MGQLDDEQFDVETAFLIGDLDEEIYMELPELYTKYLKEKGTQNVDNATHCAKLLKAIYGLVQAARQWWKKFKEVLRGLGYEASQADPCLFVKKEGDPALINIYVDDGQCLGNKKTIEETLSELSEKLNITRQGETKTFVGCDITMSDEKDTMWLTQPKIIEHLKQQFGHEVKGKKAIIPATGRYSVTQPKEGEALLSPERQSCYCLGVGMLM